MPLVSNVIKSPFGKRNTQPQVVQPKPPGGDGMIPPELDTDRRPNLNPKTQTGGKVASIMRRKPTGRAYA